MKTQPSMTMILLRDDPYLASGAEEAKPHNKIRIMSTLDNSVDGSGAWAGIHLLDADGQFIQGGWVQKKDVSAHAYHTFRNKAGATV